MCGILGIYCKNQEQDIEEIEKSFEMLSNRGPDCSCLIKTTEEILGFKRLSIVDTTMKGIQPFISKQNNKLLCNGEIFNHKILEKEHEIKCESKSDCECILHLYEKNGFESAVNSLNGDFAILLKTNTKLFFARDRVGVRPLFCGKTRSGNIAFASYARALINYCSDIEQIKPGWGFYDSVSNKIFFNNYISFDSVTYPSDLFSINRMLTKSVKDRLMSDRSIGCLLSGGLDSSLITSILCRLIGPEKVRTYSIGMKGSKDLKYAKKVSDFLGTNHTEVLFTPQEGFDCIPKVISDLESYDITTIRASVGMWLLAKHISEQTDDIVLFSGEGADEIFCGYLYFHHAPSAKEAQVESARLVNQMYLYDVLRADRCISSFGLELRVPFLDRNILEFSKNVESGKKIPKNGIEKHILRKAFDKHYSFDKNYLPDEVLWRRKDGLSDGVSGDNGKKWFEEIQEFVDHEISDAEYEESKVKFPSKEAFYYKKKYDEMFPNYQPKYDYWLPKWVDHGGDPSGRILKVPRMKITS
jgi:asparagine synthase (glutamine-hydrolysing)